jgi:hypothetical protein
MSTDRKAAIVVGVLFIVAAVVSVVALGLYGPILNDPDFVIKGSGNDNQVLLGALLELIVACAVAGTSITLFPFLKRHNESIALGYVCFRLTEAILIVIGVISLVALVTLRQEYAGATAANLSSLQTSAKLLVAVHNWTFLLGPDFMLGINTTMCSYLLFRTKLVPRPISSLGMIGAALIFTAAIFEMFGVFPQISTWGAILAIPVACYEMSLAVWSIAKGFNLTTISALPQEPARRKGKKELIQVS